MTFAAKVRLVLLAGVFLPTLPCVGRAVPDAATEQGQPIPIINGSFTQPLDGGKRGGWRLPAHEEGYDARIVAGGNPPESACVLVTGAPKLGDAGAFGTISQGIDAAPYRGRCIRLRAEVRASPTSLTGASFLWLRVDRAGGRQGFFDNMADRPIAEDVWKTYEITGEVAPDATRIVFGMGVIGSGQARLRCVMLSALGPIDLARANREPISSLQGPGIIHIAMEAPVRALGAALTGTVTIPMPGIYREQVPLDFRLTATPAGALQGYRFARRPDGRNWVCVARVTPPKKGAMLNWQSDVLVFERTVALLPKMARPEVPAEAAPWTRATACVQSGDPAIQAKAHDLAQGDPDVETYVRRVIAFTSTNRGTGAKFDSLDAAKAIICGGSCTNRANLAAALLRARGIPARTVSHMPAWSQGQPFYEHWLTEYWHPGVGWVWIEPTLGQMQPSPTDVAVLSVSNPEDEDKAFDPVHLRFVMPGAAYLSVCEFSPELTAADLVDSDAINTVRAVARIAGTPPQMAQLKAAARSAFLRLTAQTLPGNAADPSDERALLAAARTGRASALTAALSALK